ncbi:MAG TPA: FG-GAP-like repeat-containing protein [Nevskiaceae bacterium]|nr:FG-GAP-like repeat-containing protein [Nevskiaceae bacterium]
MRALVILLCFVPAFADAANTITLTGGEIGNPGTDTPFTFWLRRSGNVDEGAFIRYQTVDGTAKAGVDYGAAGDGVTVPPGVDTFGISIGLIGEPGPQPDKSFSLNLGRVIPTAGPRTFTMPQSFPAPHAAGRPAVGDLNGDGLPDLATFYFTEAPGHEFTTHVMVFLNTTPARAARTSFASPQTLDFRGFSTAAIALADVNGDGKPDLVLLRSLFNPGVSVLLNTTDAGDSTVTFAPAQGVAANGPGVALAVADLDGDGRPDLIATDNTNKLVVALNRTDAGSSTISFTHDVFSNMNGSQPVVADVDLDGRPDIVQLSGGGIAFLPNRTTSGTNAASFAPVVRVPFNTDHGTPVSLASLNVNADRRPDLAIGISKGQVYELLVVVSRLGKDGLPHRSQTRLPVDHDVSSLAVADFNGDGLDDLAIGDLADQDPRLTILVSVTRNASMTPEFVATEYHVGQGVYPSRLAIGDVNVDGNPDLVFAGDAVFTVLNRFHRAVIANHSATATIHYP